MECTASIVWAFAYVVEIRHAAMPSRSKTTVSPAPPGNAYTLQLHLDPASWGSPSRDELARLEATARGLTRLIDSALQLEYHWSWTGQKPLLSQQLVPAVCRL